MEGQNPPTSLAASVDSKSLVTSTVPRLISIVEIVKREFVKAMVAKKSLRLAGLHQYNELGCLEDLGLANRGEEDEDRPSALARALDGKRQWVYSHSNALVRLRSSRKV